jgi:hypothetical protein
MTTALTLSPEKRAERDDLVARLRALEPALRARGVTRLGLFGSRARGDHRPDSDVDLTVDVEHGRKFSLLDLAGVQNLVTDSIGLEANLFLRRSLDGTWVEELGRDEFPVYG